jgi:hypothetical protein
LKKNDHVITQLKIGENVITQPRSIPEGIADYFSSIFNYPSSVVFPNNVHFYYFVNVPSISDSDVKQAIRRLSSSKCVGSEEIPSFMITDSSETLPLFDELHF